MGLVAPLGVCPLLADSPSVINRLVPGLATTAALAPLGSRISLLRDDISHRLRLPAFVFIIAAIVILIDLSMHAGFHARHTLLGIFILLRVTHCAIMGRPEA